jgi:hypothetical protein
LGSVLHGRTARKEFFCIGETSDHHRFPVPLDPLSIEDRPDAGNPDVVNPANLPDKFSRSELLEYFLISD